MRVTTPSQREGFFMEKSYVKLFRNILQWSWYSDTPTFRVFLHLLLTANFADKKWRNIIIKRGQRIISYRKLAKTLNLSMRQTRTAIDHLKSTHELTQSSTNKYTIIQVQNYDKYQSTDTVIDTVIDKQPTHNRHTLSIYKNDNKKDNKNTPYSPPKPKEVLSLTPQHLQGFLKEFPILTLEEIQQEALRTRSYIKTTTSPITNPFMFFRSRLVIADREKHETENMNGTAAQTINLPELSEKERAANRERLAIIRKQLREKFTI